MKSINRAVASVGKDIYYHPHGNNKVSAAPGTACDNCGSNTKCLSVELGKRRIVGCPTCLNNVVAGLKLMIGYGIATDGVTLGYGQSNGS